MKVIRNILHVLLTIAFLFGIIVGIMFVVVASSHGELVREWFSIGWDMSIAFMREIAQFFTAEFMEVI